MSDGDNRTRLTCPDCGYIAYQNPKVVAGAVCTWEGKFLLCRRAIDPRLGFWTVPAGYLELNETTAEGAKREAYEEALATIEVTGLIGVFELPHISQIYVIHRARMTDASIAPGPESEAVDLFRWQDIPWDDLAFTSVRWALERSRAELPPGHEISPPGF